MSGSVKVVKTKLFIGNLDPGTQSDELTELFSAFGTVLEASVIKDYGFVHYGSIEEAEKAAIALNNKEFHGKRLRVELSTSTVRHRPGQPEPASFLRYSRNRPAGKGSSNGMPWHSSGVPAGGVGPMRHSSSAWIRSDTRPYDRVSIDHSIYDRMRPYNVRPEPRRYYEDRRDNVYGTGYDIPDYVSDNSSEQTGITPYRDLNPHTRVDGYGLSRPYDRHLSASVEDSYYRSTVPQGAPPSGDLYLNYDSYDKYYGSRPRDPEFPAQRDYHLYTSHRSDPCESISSQGSFRHDLPTSLQQPQGLYPPSYRQHASYASGSYNVAQYYGGDSR